MNHKKSRKIVNGLSLIVVGLSFISNLPIFNSIRMEMFVGTSILMIITIIFGLVFLRCPNYHKRLNLYADSQLVCQNCGKRLDDNT